MDAIARRARARPTGRTDPSRGATGDRRRARRPVGGASGPVPPDHAVEPAPTGPGSPVLCEAAAGQARAGRITARAAEPGSVGAGSTA